MIVFDLECSQGHRFEGWFGDSRAYEKQKKQKMIECPVCGDQEVDKALSAFAIKKSGARGNMGNLPSPPSPEEFAALVERVNEYVDKNFEDVGTGFAKEALKIHYGVSEKRNIKGISTEAEEKTLKEEGVEFIKFPRLGRDSNPQAIPEHSPDPEQGKGGKGGQGDKDS